MHPLGGPFYYHPEMKGMALWLLTSNTEMEARWKRLLAFAGNTTSFSRPEDVPTSGWGLLVVDAATAPDGQPISRRAGMVLLLTSHRPLADAAVADSLLAGYDDYIPAFLDDRLIEAKLRAHLRRHVPTLGVVSAGAPKGVKTIARLTPTERRLLELFQEWPGRVLTRERLLVHLRAEKAENLRPGTVDKHVESLRRKLGPRGPSILTVYGTGYVLEEKS